MIKSVIFDFNGTLFDDGKYHKVAWGIVSKELRGYPLTIEEMNHKLNGYTNENILKYVTEDSLSKEELIYQSSRKEAIYRDIVKEIEGGAKLIDGATDFFKFLIKKNIPFTISSASIKENIDFFIKTFKLDSFFDVSTIVYDDGRFNNKGQMYKESLKVMNFIPEETLIFEDSITGIKGAYEAGVKDVIAIYNENLLNRYKEFPLKKIVTNYNNLSDLF